MTNQNTITCSDLAHYLSRENYKDFFFLLKKLLEAQGGLSKASEETSLNRESLYKTLSGERDPRLSTILVLLGYLGIEINFNITAKSLEKKFANIPGFEPAWMQMYLETPKERLKSSDKALEHFAKFNNGSLTNLTKNSRKL